MAGPAFATAADVEQFFRGATGQDFISWFNARHAAKGGWGENPPFHGRSIQAGAAAQDGFRQVCDHLSSVFGRPATLEEFLCLASIIINETSSFLPVTEGVGRQGHPAIAYAFDSITDIKRSYNGAPNKTAGELFRDPIFLAAHGHRAQANLVANTTDPAWDGTSFPQGQFSTSEDPAVSGIILEADFYKFRGRGLIQTTFRSNYLELVSFIQACEDPNPVIQEYRQAWAGKAPDEVATISSNEDWDRLFQQSNGVLPLAAIRLHSQGAGNYLALSSDPNVFGSEQAGSAFRMGWRVTGSQDYGRLFKRRVFQLREDLTFDPDDLPMTPHSSVATWWANRTLEQAPGPGNFTMQARGDFGLPADARRVRFGAYLAGGTGLLRFFNADGSEADPIGWGGTKPLFGATEVTMAPDGSVAFRVEQGSVTTEMVRSLGYWT